MKTMYHLIGIGGIGMSALARVLYQQGVFVQGSDQKDSALLRQLHKEGILVHIGHNSQWIKPGMKVVYSSDIKQDNVEKLKALELGLELWHRSDLLDFCMKEKKPLLVTGTHGKTTTSSLLAHLLCKAGLDPSFVVGGIALNTKTNGYAGKGEYFVAEADESDGSFLKTAAFGAIITNLENEHLAYWKTPEALDRGFSQFFAKVQEPIKHLFWCADDPRLGVLGKTFLGNSYGFSEKADWKIFNLRYDAEGLIFDISYQDKIFSALKAPLFGQHNALNMAAAFALAWSLGVPEQELRLALGSFCGVKRRLELKGEIKTIQFFDDYGHHPTEIDTTLLALRKKIANKRLIVLFQPHRYTRVQELLESFAGSFEAADKVIMTDIYGAGENLIEGIFSKLLHSMQERLAEKFLYIPKEELVQKVTSLLYPNDVVLTIGAGDITYAGEEILCHLSGQ